MHRHEGQQYREDYTYKGTQMFCSVYNSEHRSDIQLTQLEEN